MGPPRKVLPHLSRQGNKPHSLKQAKMSTEQLKTCPPRTRPPHTLRSRSSRVDCWEGKMNLHPLPPVLSVKTASQWAEIALITVTILHRVKTTFVRETGSSASLEFLAGEQLLSERGFLLLSREGNTNHVSPPSQRVSSPLFQLPDSGPVQP